MLLRSLLLFLFALCASTGVADERDTSLNASSLFRYPPKAFANHTKQVPTDNVWKAATEDDDNLTPDQRWCRYISRGTSLMKAMMMSEMEARLELNWSYVQSPWDGGMEKELQSWGYLDSEELHLDHDGDCDFDTKHKLGNVFRDTDKLNTDPRSSGQGGPNHCFYIQHSDSPAMIRSQDDEMPDVADQRYWVNDKEYRATDAHAGIGVNPQDGFVYFLDRASAQEAARWTWQRAPAPNELPALRSTSDIAFAF